MRIGIEQRSNEVTKTGSSACARPHCLRTAGGLAVDGVGGNPFKCGMRSAETSASSVEPCGIGEWRSGRRGRNLGIVAKYEGGVQNCAWGRAGRRCCSATGCPRSDMYGLCAVGKGLAGAERGLACVESACARPRCLRTAKVLAHGQCLRAVNGRGSFGIFSRIGDVRCSASNRKQPHPTAGGAGRRAQFNHWQALARVIEV